MRARGYLLLMFLVAFISNVHAQLFNLNPPTITGQRPTPLVTGKNSSIAISFQNLRVTDPDFLVPAYPQGYTLTVMQGENYAVTNTTVTPDAGFTGTLTVPVKVNDGKFDSNVFDLTISVTNEKPVITDHVAIAFKEGSSFRLLLTHLTVVDPDNSYPNDFTLTVYGGNNYTFSGTTVTPQGRFSGTLSVLVSVSDGETESDKFVVKMDVRKNIVPAIKSQTALTVNQGKKLTVDFGNLVVDDADNNYPSDFTLSLHAGANYTLDGLTVIPNPTFYGILRVPVSVNDGLDESSRFELRVEVAAKNNIRPQVMSQDALGIDEDSKITLRLDHLNVNDPDNIYPDDFTLKVQQGPGQNYSVTGATITPDLNFNGVIEVPVRVNDGMDDSDAFRVSITVNPINDMPVITGQREILIRANRSTIIDITRLDVFDPDVENTTEFTLRILPGEHYTASGSSIRPEQDFVGELKVSVIVNDGIVDSAPFEALVEVVPGGSAPLITGQHPLVSNEDATLRLKLEDLIVTDDDDSYPNGFSLRIHPPKQPNAYTYNALDVTPAKEFSGPLTVYVSVSDGDEESPEFALTVIILPVNDAPIITALETLPITFEPGSGPVYITESLTLEDVDSDYFTFAEISFADSSFSALNDRLVFQNSDKIRGIYDRSKGILSLIGIALKADYDSAIRTVQYDYELTTDEQGNTHEVRPASKVINISVSDGQLVSAIKHRVVRIETNVELTIPNAFTPNGDKSNDTWRIYAGANASQFDRAIIRIYNRKGLIIFEGQGLLRSWDGTYRGETVPPGNYFYTIELNLSYTRKTYKGIVTVLR